MTVKEFIKSTGMTQKQLSERFGIPRRTIEDWSRGVSKCPEYVVKMMQEILDRDKEEKKSMYKAFVIIDGILENVNDINRGIEAQTDIVNFFDPEDEGWRAWVEWKDGKTIVLEEEA